jgi:hypothetical protein
MVYVHLNIFKRDFILFLFPVTGRAVAIQMLEIKMLMMFFRNTLDQD